MKDLSVFAKNLKAARERAGMKQNELADKIDVTPQTISAYEKAEVGSKGKNPTLENALAIAEALQVSLDELCGREDVCAIRSAEKTKREIAEDFVFLNNVPDIEFSTVTRTKTITHGFAGEYPEYEDIKVEYPAIIIKDSDIGRFIKSWYKIQKLYNDGTIDDELYNLWVDKHINDVSDVSAVPPPLDWSKIKTEEFCEAEIDGELPF